MKYVGVFLAISFMLAMGPAMRLISCFVFFLAVLYFGMLSIWVAAGVYLLIGFLLGAHHVARGVQGAKGPYATILAWCLEWPFAGLMYRFALGPDPRGPKGK